MKTLACLISLLALPALAQQELPEQATPVKAAPLPAVSQLTLEAGLPQLDWDPVRRGALLLIAPNKLLLEGKTPLPPPRTGYGLPELVGYFNQQVVRFPTLTTAGPLQISELRTPKAIPDLSQEIFQTHRPQAFLASLTPGQLQRAAGPQGIGYSDLTDERQRGLWEKLFPPTLNFVGTTSVPPGMVVGQSPWYGKQSLPVLSPAMQRTFRIRLRLEVRFVAQPGGYSVRLEEFPSGSHTVALRRLPVAPDQVYQLQQEQRKENSGVQKVPYRRKPSDLDLSQERFSVPIVLADATTVGDIVQRAAKALRLELYADARLATLPVYVRIAPGQSVSAADALQAILRATSSTVRRLQAGPSTAFVITYDRVPLGNLLVGLFDTLLPQEMGKMQEQLADEKAQRGAMGKLRQAKLLTLLPRTPGSALSEALWQTVEQGRDTPFPLAELPGAVTARLKAAWAARQRPGPDGALPPREPQGAVPTGEVAVQVLCPTLGEAPLATLSVKELQPQPETPKVALPERIKTRGLRVRSPQTAGEAKQLLALARAQGFTTLYIALSGDANDDRGVALLAAEKDALPLVPTLSPLIPAPTDTQRERDLSVTGRTATEMAQGRPALGAIAQILPFISPLFEQITRLDALTPEAVPVDRFVERLARLAALPGVAQLGLHDLAALGYRENEQGLETLWTGGYSATERLAFLRAQSIDPADFLDTSGFPGGGSFTLPFFSDSELNATLRAAWSARCKVRAAQLQKRLETSLLAAKLTKPLLKLDGGFVMMDNQQWKLWKGGAGPLNLPYWEALVRLGPGGDGDSLDEPSVMRKALTQILEQRPLLGDSTPEVGPTRSVSSTGFVYDLSNLPLSQALTLLETVIARKN